MITFYVEARIVETFFHSISRWFRFSPVKHELTDLLKNLNPINEYSLE